MRTFLTLWVNITSSFSFAFSSVILFCASAVGDLSAQQVIRQVPYGYQTNFWVYTPPSYLATGPGHPLLISLHGGSGIVDNDDYNAIVDQSNVGDRIHLTPGRLIYQNLWNTALPFIVVSPHLKRDFSIALVNDQNWPPDLVDEVIEYVKTQYNVDDSRIYITGISVGGAGTWNYAIAYPEKVAAILPLSGKAAKGDACAIKDVPIWAFHGQDDGLVPSRFSTDMVEEIADCSPAGLYKPQLTLPASMAHDVWNSIYLMRSGYDIYNWLLSFRKGNFANKAPVVNAGVNRTFVYRPGPMYLSGDYFDSDGSITNVQWTQVSNLAIDLQLADTDTKFVRINNPQNGTFILRLTVTDDDGMSSYDEVQITIVASHARTLNSLTMHNQAGSTTSASLGNLADDQVWDISTLGTRINIQTTAAAASPTTSRVRWSINGFQHTRDNGIWGPNNAYPIKDVLSNATNTGWGVYKGTYLICATPYSNSSFANEGASSCYKITFSDEVGITKYYATGADISALTSWNSNEDGSGSSPASFGSNNQWFILNGTASLAATSLTISGTNSRLIVSTTGELNISNVLTGPFYVEGKGKVTITGSGSVATFTSASRTSHVIYGTGATSIPGANISFGHLTLKGGGQKNHAGGVTFVRGNLTVEAGTDLRNNGINGSSAFNVTGNVTIGTVSSLPYTLRFFEGYGNQYLTLPGSHAFRIMSVEGGGTASVLAPAGTTITIGSGTGGGQLDIHTNSLLKLNGHNLTLLNLAALNVTSGGGIARTGTIELDNSVLTISSTTATTTTLNLYPAKGKNNLKSLDVTIPAANAGLNILDSLNITQNIKVTTGKINSNGFISLVSTGTGASSSTAYVSPIASGSIEGNVNVQRMVPAGKMYRYFSFPVLDYRVNELQTYIPVTGEFSGGNPSLFYYDETDPDQWIAYPKVVNTEVLDVGRGYAAYIRETASPKKLIMTGGLYIGTLNYAPFLTPNPTPADPETGWNLLGNPYATPIEWNHTADWTKTDIYNFVYVRDNDYNNGQGRYLIWNGVSTGDAEFSGIISSGQSFWVRSLATTPALSVTENAKVESTTPEFYRKKQSDAITLSINMKQNGLEDKAYVNFQNDGAGKFNDKLDGIKKKNGYYNISILSNDSVAVAIKTLCDTVCSQEIGLAVEPKNVGTYSLTAEGNAFDQVIDKLFIIDKFEKTTTELEEGKEYVFQVTSDSESLSKYRFRLIAEKGNVAQPVISLNEGVLTSSIAENVQWMLNGADIEGATGSVYAPVEDGDYTVKTLGKNCAKVSAVYSYRVTALPEESITEIKLYPNPATNTLKISGLKSSGYGYNIITLSGASLQGGTLHLNESGEGEIRLNSIAAGFYILKIAGAEKIHQFKFSVK
jgi:predicted esterase